MKDKSRPDEWLNSKQARKALKVSVCDLMHLREAGKVSFQKKGNAYLYSKEAVAQAQRDTPKTRRKR